MSRCSSAGKFLFLRWRGADGGGSTQCSARLLHGSVYTGARLGDSVYTSAWWCSGLGLVLRGCALSVQPQLTVASWLFVVLCYARLGRPDHHQLPAGCVSGGARFLGRVLFPMLQKRTRACIPFGFAGSRVRALRLCLLQRNQRLHCRREDISHAHRLFPPRSLLEGREPIRPCVAAFAELWH